MILPYAWKLLACCAPVFFLVHGLLGFARFAAKVLPAIFYRLHVFNEWSAEASLQARVPLQKKPAASFGHEVRNKEGFFATLAHSDARSC